jgi:murein DD-endopeptidase MepM/ murein hydrolase activator NlpD
MMKYLLIPALLTLTLSLWTETGRADIYRHVDESGTAWFTDTPATKGYVTVLKEMSKEPARSRQDLPNRPAPAKSNATGEKNSGEKTGQFTSGLPVQGRVTSTRGLRHDPFDGKLRHHNGIDIAAPTGTPVKPVAPGQVIFSGNRSGYGLTVIVDHQDGSYSVYAHHSRNLVTEGEIVDGGTVIALTGSTGRSTGPHLHFEAWRDGENITNFYLPGASDQSGTTLAAAQRETPIRRVLKEDGTLLFTNL